MEDKEKAQFRTKMLAVLRKLNKSAKHYFVNPPGDGSDKWRAGWVDDPLRPKVCFMEQDVNPQILLERLEKESLSK